MQKLLSLGLAVILAAACADQPTSPADTLDAPDIRAAVKIVDINVVVPIAFTGVDNACTPFFDDITLVGTDHQIFKLWDNGHAKLHLQFNLSGESAAGVKYKVDDQVNEQTNNLPTTWSNNFKLISQGNTPNFVGNLTIQTDKDGNTTVKLAGTTCRG